MATKQPKVVTVRFFSPEGTVVEAQVAGRLVEMPAKRGSK